MIRSMIFATAVLFSGIAIAEDAKVDFQKDVWPILNDNCVKCHRAPYESKGKMKKPKGDLRLDDKAEMLKGGEDGKVIVPGNPDKSPLYSSTILPRDKDEAMPPDGKGDPLSDKDKATLKAWIQQGADFGAWTMGEYTEK